MAAARRPLALALTRPGLPGPVTRGFKASDSDLVSLRPDRVNLRVRLRSRAAAAAHVSTAA